MIDFKKVKTETTAITRQKDQFYAGTGNIYETVAILSKRANQIAAEEKQELNKKIEKLIWQGDKTTHSTDTDLKWIDGFLHILTAEGVHAEGTFNTAYDAILGVYNALPEEVLERGAEIYVSPAVFREFMQAMVAKNYFNYNPGNQEFGEFLLPGSDAKIVRTQGLAGSKVVVGTFAQNLVYGCDMENDEEKFDIWFSQDNRTWRVAVEWNSGVQIAFPDMAVYASITA